MNRFTVFLSVLIATLAGVDSAMAGLSSCRAIFGDAFNSRDQSLRQTLLKKLPAPVKYVVQGEVYIATHLLGSSSTRVYLGFARDGQQVVIKPFPEDSPGKVDSFWRSIMKQEIAKTAAIAEFGIPSSRIIGFNLEQGVIIKEYSRGLTLDEIEEFQSVLHFNENQILQFKSSLESVISRISGMEARILESASKFGQEIQALEGASDLRRFAVHPLDKKPTNFLFDFQKQDWVFFDP